VAARLDVPVIGADADPYCAAGRWRVSTSWRYQRSFRHFVGTEEQVDRETEQSQVINTINIADLTARYAATPRISLSISIPYMMANRSSPIRDANRVVVDRSVTHAYGLSDIIVSGRRWMLDPARTPRGNFSLGLGFKLPTGPNSVVDARGTLTGGTIVQNFQVVDQSIQPGDGGFGILFDLQSFLGFASNKAAVYLSGSYLSNPKGTNGVQTFRSRPSEAVMSVADQYLARAGAATVLPKLTGFSLSGGLRLEGVPVRDLMGPSDGFRRPGLALSIEPGLAYGRGRNSFSVAVPFAIHRDRKISVSDEQVGGHGDAAFADWLLLAGFERRF
jgi:hypothetical protein